jgi:hypothetical protein
MGQQEPEDGPKGTRGWRPAWDHRPGGKILWAKREGMRFTRELEVEYFEREIFSND